MKCRLIPARLILCFTLILLFGKNITLAYTPLNATQLKAVMPSSTRYVMSLAGDWERSIDGNEWTIAKLPMSESYSGKITYRRTLQIDPQLVGRYMWNLYFLGLSDAVELTVNNQYVGRSFGGMVPFMVRIPDKYIKAGRNDIQLEISPASDEAVRMRKLDLFGQRSYTGVVRELLLVGTPQAMISDLRTSIQFASGDAQVSVMANILTGALDRISGAADSSGRAIELTTSQVTIDAELRFDGTGSIVANGSQTLALARDRSTDATFSFRVSNPALWTPQSPQLYTLTITIKANGVTVDELNSQVGMIAVQDGNLSSQSLLTMNGSPLFVKAVDYVEDAPGGGASVTADGLERDVQLMKTLGVNAIRTRFFAPHPYLVYLCNKYGLLIIADMPVYNVPSSLMNSDEVVGRMKNIAERMIIAYERQPSIAAWNISEGLEQSSSVTYNYIGTIAGILHKQSQRPVLATVRFRSKNVMKDNVDGIIYTIDRFDMSPTQITSELQRVSQAGGKPFAFAFGKPINPTNRNGYADPISLEAQARYVKTCYEALMAAQAGGACAWSLTDYTLNRSTILTNTSGQYYCYSGLSDANRQKRIAFDMYKSLLNDEKDPLLQAGSYNETMPFIFIILGVVLILVLVLMMNRSRRFREYVIRAMIYPYNFYSDIRDQRILSRQQTAVLCFIIAATGGILLSTLLFYTRMSAIAEYAIMLLFPQEGMKGFISSLAWSPELGVAVITLSLVIAIIGIALLLRAGALFVRGRIFFSDTFIIAVWSALPMVLFLPFCTILFRALDVTSVTFWVILLAIVLLWILYRTLRATSVVFDVNPLPVYAIGIAIIASVVGAIGFMYNSSYSFFAYTKYFLSAVL